MVEFTEQHRSLAVALICEALRITQSTYYANAAHRTNAALRFSRAKVNVGLLLGVLRLLRDNLE